MPTGTCSDMFGVWQCSLRASPPSGVARPLARPESFPGGVAGADAWGAAKGEGESARRPLESGGEVTRELPAAEPATPAAAAFEALFALRRARAGPNCGAPDPALDR
mmetsp:Transcript_50766/g.91613  ORF Transcript_50766/g.91613 Transcript_50766/m.91613 type:complete len:107 (+) Transcript_50766:795-1115(+)